MLTQVSSKYHKRINDCLAEKVEELYDLGYITHKGFNLYCRILSRKAKIRNAPISYTKQQLVTEFKIDVTHFARDYSCLAKTGVWKKIDKEYVIHPQLLFAGHQYHQDLSMRQWQLGKLYKMNKGALDDK
jgi:hypothetical protein